MRITKRGANNSLFLILLFYIKNYLYIYILIMEKIINKILSNELLVITFTLLIFAILDVNRWFYLLAPTVTYFVIFVVQLISIFTEVYRNGKARN